MVKSIAIQTAKYGKNVTGDYHDDDSSEESDEEDACSSEDQVLAAGPWSEEEEEFIIIPEQSLRGPEWLAVLQLLLSTR